VVIVVQFYDLFTLAQEVGCSQGKAIRRGTRKEKQQRLYLIDMGGWTSIVFSWNKNVVNAAFTQKFNFEILALSRTE
jgi:hypothetical protein